MAYYLAESFFSDIAIEVTVHGKMVFIFYFFDTWLRQNVSNALAGVHYIFDLPQSVMGDCYNEY